MELSTALRLVRKLAGFFPGTPDVTVAAYAEAIMAGRWDVSIVEDAVDLCIENLDRLPSWAQLREVIRGIRGPQPALDLSPTPETRELAESALFSDEELRQFLDESYWKGRHRPTMSPEQRKAFYQAKARQIAEEYRAGLEVDRAVDAQAVVQEFNDDPTGRLNIVREGRVSKPGPFRHDGPDCRSCGKPTMNDGGDCWYCPDDGWLQFIRPRRSA